MISKVSKGTRMDQIYIPKNRPSLPIGSYVVIKPLEEKIIDIKPVFYSVKNLEPIKIEIIKEIIKTIEQHIKNDNIIITGSFLDKGFRFNDIDVIIIKEKTDTKNLKEILENKVGIKIHLIQITNKALKKGLETDPLYQLMLSRCAAKVRFIHKIKKEINYKILDLHLLRSRPFIDNFDFLTGNEKYQMIRNLISIKLFIEGKEISKKAVDSQIKSDFKEIEKIKDNVIMKSEFIDKYKKIYNETKNKILKGIENEQK